MNNARDEARRAQRDHRLHPGAAIAIFEGAGVGLRRAGVAVAVTAVLAGVLTRAPAATPGTVTLSLSHRVVRWSGGPLTGVGEGEATCTAATCDDLLLVTTVPSSAWARSGGGIAIRVQWPSQDDEFDLYVYDAKGAEVARSDQAHTNFEQAFIAAPTPGTYRVHLVGFDVFADVRYTGVASIVGQDGRASAAADTMRFSQSIVDPQAFGVEPSIWADRSGVFVAAPRAIGVLASYVWGSNDGARTFRRLDGHVAGPLSAPLRGPCAAWNGSGDTDVILDRTGRLYMTDLSSATIGTAYSTDRGLTWSCNLLASSSPEDDRPWLAPSPSADGSGPNVDAYLAYRDGLVGTTAAGDKVKPLQVHVDVTRDGGKTWVARGTFGLRRVDFAGPIFTAADGTVYESYDAGGSVWIARSRDGGRTFASMLVSKRYGLPRSSFTSGAVDQAGNVYAAWIDSGSWDAFYSVSRDGGAHWTKPLRLNPPASDTTYMPWVTAGRAGDVAVAWIGTRERAAPGSVSNGARWNAWVARSLNGTSSSPRFQVARLSETPMHFGPLCLPGSGCTDGLKDFFEIAIAPDGGIVAAFPDNGRIHIPDPVEDNAAQAQSDPVPAGFIVVARQASGLGMSRAAAARASAYEPAGAGERSPASSPFEFTSPVSARLDPVAVTLSFSLRSAGNLARAVATEGPIASTDAYCVAVWKANDRLEYAGLHVDAKGAAQFFGGLEPAAAGFVEPYATYPATMQLLGRIDSPSGRVSIEVPLSSFDLSAGSLLHDLQGFSLVGVSSVRTDAQWLTLVDVTPARTIAVYR